MTAKVAKAKAAVEKLLAEVGLGDNVVVEATVGYDYRGGAKKGLKATGTDIMDCSNTVYIVDQFFRPSLMVGYFVNRYDYIMASPEKQKEVIAEGLHPSEYKVTS